jgi:regulator of protease activity HflC (stomatin/prohibitin superfamily)
VEVGSIKDPVNSGFHVMVPWADVHTFSTRLQELSMLAAVDEGDKAKDDSVEVRGSDGYEMNVDITVRYFIEGSEASTLFRLVGSEDGVKQRLVRPDVRNRTRVAFAEFTSEEGYTSQRDKIAANLAADLTPRMAAYGLRLESVSIRNVKPDPVLAKAISDRAAAREQALQAGIEQKKLITEAETRRKVAETDARAKVIAAQGEADSNRIITQSITSDLLTLKQIEALRDANTVYIAPGTSIIVGQTPK